MAVQISCGLHGRIGLKLFEGTSARHIPVALHARRRRMGETPRRRRLPSSSADAIGECLEHVAKALIRRRRWHWNGVACGSSARVVGWMMQGRRVGGRSSGAIIKNVCRATAGTLIPLALRAPRSIRARVICRNNELTESRIPVVFRLGALFIKYLRVAG